MSFSFHNLRHEYSRNISCWKLSNKQLINHILNSKHFYLYKILLYLRGEACEFCSCFVGFITLWLVVAAYLPLACAPTVLFPLQNQEILNRSVFVLEILEKSEQTLNILSLDWKFWTDSEHSEDWLKILSKFWTLPENSEQSLIILNIDWKFWTKSEHS